MLIIFQKDGCTQDNFCSSKKDIVGRLKTADINCSEVFAIKEMKRNFFEEIICLRNGLIRLTCVLDSQYENNSFDLLLLLESLVELHSSLEKVTTSC